MSEAFYLLQTWLATPTQYSRTSSSLPPCCLRVNSSQWLAIKGTRIVIPSSLRLSILDRLHSGHQGVTKCRARARQTVWWPGLSNQLQDLVHNCSKCRQSRHRVFT